MTTSLRRFLMPIILTLFVSFCALSALADPPSRAVRIKYISGAVSLQPGGVNDWVAAVVNRPLTTSDRVWTDKEARAELHLGSAALRMNAETSLTFTNVGDDIVQVELDQGTLNLHIRHLFGGETYEIDTPNQAFTIMKAGDYRFDVDPNADTTSVTVWKGEGEANGQGPGVRLRSGHQATFTGGTSLEHQTASAPGLDGFDDWCRVRDDREDHAKSYQYVSADVVGADDLDEYGTWRVEAAYGPVWVPAVAPGWAPYRNGHWVWVEPWGWTWVDEAPWGFAPCHYGRWVHLGGYWAWAPGPVVVARPVYAPALVAWVGGPHFGLNLAFGGGGGVAWFPLGWGEPYVPSYHVSRNYFQQVNVTNTRITNITTVTNNYYVTNNNTTIVNNNVHNIRYVNQNVTGAVTAVPTRAMTNSDPVARAAVAVPASELRTAAVVNTAAVAPARTSLLGTRSGAPTALPPSRVMAARPVVSRVAPPARPVPFEVREEALAKTPGRPLDAQTESQLRSNMARRIPPAAQAPAQPMQPVRPGSPMATSPNGIQPRPVSRPNGPQVPSAVGAVETMPTTGNAPATPEAGQAVRPETPVATNPNGIQRRPVPRPGKPQMSGENTDAAGVRPVTPSPQPTSESAQPVRPGSPMATSPSGIQARPVPRPGGSPMSSGNRDVVDAKPVTTTVQPSQPVAPGRSVPPSQPGVQTSPAVRGESTNVGRPGPRSVQTSGATNMESPRPNPPSSPRPGASTGVIRPSVENRPTAPRSPQSVSMPRSEPAPQASSHANTVVQAPRQNTRHENKAQQNKREEKSDRKPNR
jgi:Family of unknown function (DUF6600)